MRSVGLLIILASLPAQAHDGGLGFLDLQAEAPGDYRFSFATRGKGAQKLSPRFPSRCKASLLPVYPLQGRLRCGSSLRGAVVGFHRPKGAHPMVIARLQEDGEDLQSSAQLPDPLLIPKSPGTGPGLGGSLALGFGHFLAGWDHLFFLLVLTLCVRNLRSLVILVTAFTLGHGLSLTLAGIGWVRFPVAVVETLIALSIVLVARSALRQRSRMSWPLVLGVGWIHGLGFAGMLDRLGLDRGELLPKLLGFNLGLELAQLALVAGLLAAGWSLARLGKDWALHARRVSAYTAGGYGLAWTVERSGAILGL